MLKKLLTVCAAAFACTSLYAGEMVVDYTSNWQNEGWHFYEMGYAPEVVDGILVSENPMNEDGTPAWYQYFIADGIHTTPGTTYYVTAKIKASEEVTFNLNMGWGWGQGEQIGKPITATTEWSEVTLAYPEVGGTSSNLIAQPGTSLAKIEWEWIKVAHEEGGDPITWVNVLVNGDAEGDDTSCFKATVYGEGMNPAAIESIDGSRAFVVHATAKAEFAWDNQFFITVPEEYAIEANTDFKIAFRYKATKAAKATTQIHSTAGNYMHWQAIGDINFTTEWQEFTKLVSPSSEIVGGRTIAFNLSEFEEANDYYFDDIQWLVQDKTTAISTIENENAPTVYYNMQGMPVANPISGQFYIVKKGNKATKTIIR